MTLRLEIPSEIAARFSEAAHGEPEAYVVEAVREKMAREQSVGLDGLLDPAASDISAWNAIQRKAMALVD